MPNDADREKPAGDADVLGTPYGPHPRGVDEAAGGADSSPLDTEPTGDERRAKAEKDQGPADDRSPCQQPPGW